MLEADAEKEVFSGGVMDCRSGKGKEEDADTTIKQGNGDDCGGGK